MTICFLSVCQFNEFSGGVDRVCCLLSREFIHRGYHLIYVFGNPSALGHPAGGCEGDGQYQLPYKIEDDRNIVFFSKLVLKHMVDVVIDVAFITRYHDIAFQARMRASFKLITTYHADPFCDLKELRDKVEWISMEYKGIFLFLHLFTAYVKYPLSLLMRYKSLKSRFSKKVLESDYFVVLCEEYANQVKRIVNNNLKDRVIAINNPYSSSCDVEKFKKKNIVLFVGRMDSQKRVDRLLRIWSKIEKKINSWELVVVGDGEFLDVYKNYSQRLSLKSVRFVGRGIGPDYMKEAKILTMLSSYEGMPMVLLEALQYGSVPILFKSFSSSYVLVKHKLNGVLVRPFSESQFSRRLLDLMNNDSLLADMRNNAYLSLSSFRIETVANQWEELFHA